MTNETNKNLNMSNVYDIAFQKKGLDEFDLTITYTKLT